MKQTVRSVITLSLILAARFSFAQQLPNIVLVFVDDMGYSLPYLHLGDSKFYYHPNGPRIDFPDRMLEDGRPKPWDVGYTGTFSGYKALKGLSG
jgi:hypothetical protein